MTLIRTLTRMLAKAAHGLNQDIGEVAYLHKQLNIQKGRRIRGILLRH